MAEWKPIDELFDFDKGILQSSKCTSGKYTFVTAAEEWKTHESYTHDCEALIFAMAASGSLGRTHYIKGKFIASDLCFILTPKKGLQLDLTFYYRLFNFLRSDIVKKTATGTSKLAINQTNFGAYKLPYFDYDHQLIFRDKIEKINGISESFSLGLHDQLALLKQLRQAVLQEAIEGKLTVEWRKKYPELISGENHASKLLEKIKAEKEQLIKEGKIRKEKPLAQIKLEEVPFELPGGWVWCRLGELIVYADNFDIQKKLLPSTIINYVDIDSIDNKQHKIAEIKIKKVSELSSRARRVLKKGYIVYSTVRPYLENIAFVEEEIKHFIGSTGFNVFKALLIDQRYIFNLLLSPYINKLYKEMMIGFNSPSITNEQFESTTISLPPLAEQQAIIAWVERLMAMIDELEKQVTERKGQSERLMQSVLREAFSQ